MPRPESEVAALSVCGRGGQWWRALGLLCFGWANDGSFPPFPSTNNMKYDLRPNPVFGLCACDQGLPLLISEVLRNLFGALPHCWPLVEGESYSLITRPS